jgi:hypothetical protein
MITLMSFDTCKPAYVPEAYIDHIEEHIVRSQERDYPYSRIYIKDVGQGHDYYIDVVESKRKIKELILEKKKEGKSNEPQK